MPSNRCSAELRASLIVPHLAAEASPNQLRNIRLVDRAFCEEIDRTHAAELVLSPLACGFALKDPTHFLAHDPPEVRGAGHLSAPFLSTRGTLRFYAPLKASRLYDYALNYAPRSISPPPSSGAQLAERALFLLGGGSERSEQRDLFHLAIELCEKRKAHLHRLISAVPSVRKFDVVLTDPATDFSFVSDWLAELSDRQQRPFALQFRVENHRMAFRRAGDEYFADDQSFAKYVTRSLLSLPQTALLTRLDLGALKLLDEHRKHILFSFASMTGLKELRFRTDEESDPNNFERPEIESLDGLRLPSTLERLAIHFSPWHHAQQKNRAELQHFAGALVHLVRLRYLCLTDSSEFEYARVWEPLLPSLTDLPTLCELDLGGDLPREQRASNGTQALAALVMQSSSLRKLALPSHLLQPVELAATSRASELTLVSRSVEDEGEGSMEPIQKTFTPASATHSASFSTERGAQVCMHWLEF